MYLQITTRCNMTCAHCCYACTEKGDDMSIKTFRNALSIGDESTSIGGGEPTVHPKFYQMLCEAIGSSEYVWLATNGKKTDIALVLAKMAQNNVIGCELSQDPWHDPIEKSVVDAFTKPKGRGVSSDKPDGRGIRNISQYNEPIVAGRCDWGREDDCVCPDFIVKPNGDVMACGCADAPCFGNVNTEWSAPDDWEWGECHKKQIIE